MVDLKKLTALWHGVRDSLWFVPTTMTVGSMILALITIQIDTTDLLPVAPAGIWLFSGTASGARGVLTAIASSFITVTGVVFSITIVALQLASTQFTPRILRNFTSDRGNQLVLGAFIATFTYALLVLRVVRGEEAGMTPADLYGAAATASTGGVDTFVPHLSVTVAVVLAMVGIGFLIFYIDHAARSVQASVIIDRVTSEALKMVDRRLPDMVGEPRDERLEDVVPQATGSRITGEKSGYVQDINEDALLELLHADAYVVRLEPEIGHFLLPGSVLATVWPPGSDTVERLREPVRSAFLLGSQRTDHLDLELGLIELADMAVKALSPGVNDPTTATLCVDRLAEVVLAAGRRDPPSRIRRSSEAEGGVLIVPRTSFGSLVNTAFDEIRHYGVENPRFAFTFLHRLEDLGHLLPSHHHPAVARHVAALLRTAEKKMVDPGDLKRVQSAAHEALHALGVDHHA